MPQYNFTPQLLKRGAIGTASPCVKDSYVNALLAQVSRIAFADKDDGIYTIRMVSGDGQVVEESYTASSVANITTLITAIIAVLADAMLNVGTQVNNDPNLDITFLQTNRVWSITFPSNPLGNMSVSNTTSAGGTRIPVGVAVVQGTLTNEAVLPSASSTNADVVGFTVHNNDSEVNRANETDPTLTSGYDPGEYMSVLKVGDFDTETEDTAADNGLVYVRRVATGTEQLGDIRATGDGVARVETVTPTAVNDQIYNLKLEVDPDGNGVSTTYALAALGDASATATEICTAFKAQLAAIAALTGVITGSGTATFIMTGAAGVTFATTDQGPGVSAVVETTAGSVDTFKVNNTRFRTATTGQGLVRVQTNRPGL